jgi:hypothetical protein
MTSPLSIRKEIKSAEVLTSNVALFDLKRVKLTLETDALQGWEETQTTAPQEELQQRPVL